jgi:hypothetical protein
MKRREFMTLAGSSFYPSQRQWHWAPAHGRHVSSAQEIEAAITDFAGLSDDAC